MSFNRNPITITAKIEHLEIKKNKILGEIAAALEDVEDNFDITHLEEKLSDINSKLTSLDKLVKLIGSPPQSTSTSNNNNQTNILETPQPVTGDSWVIAGTDFRAEDNIPNWDQAKKMLTTKGSLRLPNGNDICLKKLTPRMLETRKNLRWILDEKTEETRIASYKARHPTQDEDVPLKEYLKLDMNHPFFPTNIKDVGPLSSTSLVDREGKYKLPNGETIKIKGIDPTKQYSRKHKWHDAFTYTAISNFKMDNLTIQPLPFLQLAKNTFPTGIYTEKTPENIISINPVIKISARLAAQKRIALNKQNTTPLNTQPNTPPIQSIFSTSTTGVSNEAATISSAVLVAPAARASSQRANLTYCSEEISSSENEENEVPLQNQQTTNQDQQAITQHQPPSSVPQRYTNIIPSLLTSIASTEAFLRNATVPPDVKENLQRHIVTARQELIFLLCKINTTSQTAALNNQQPPEPSATHTPALFDRHNFSVDKSNSVYNNHESPSKFRKTQI